MAITYTPTTNFGAKDSLPTNDPDKVIKGSEFTTEFTALQTALSLAAPNASPTFTGTVTIPTADINGGAIDGTIIGGATPAAASFTTVSATGNITVGGTVDGRDVAADGTKLDGVEAGADVTDTANVTAAGALMDSELTNIAAVKALNQGVATTDSPSFAGLTATGSVSLAGASTTADITFGDNDKAIFGDSSDLQIYHDGSGSYIQDTGQGYLYIAASNQLRLTNSDATEEYIRATVNGAVDIKYDNATKLATTSTGIDVTGTVTADGLTVDGSGTIATFLRDAGANGSLTLTFPSQKTTLTSLSGFKVNANSADRFDIATNGDVSFYEDTGTTAKFFWDASAEALGIGTTSPATMLELAAADNDGTNAPRLRITNSSTTLADGARVGTLEFHNSDTTGSGPTTASIEAITNSTDERKVELTFNPGFNGATTEAMRIDSDGNVGIGTSSPAYGLDVRSTIYSSVAAATKNLTLGDSTNGTISAINTNNSNLIFYADGSNESMRIDSSGKVLAGKTASDLGTAGTEIYGTGVITSTRAGNILDLNRLSTDGNIIQFRKDGTTVGSIGNNTDFYIASQDGVGLRFTSNQILPCSESGATQNNSRDLGSSSARFKDLYLSGGVYLGGTGAANLLDDYEEGTWTPVVSQGASSVTYDTQQGTYTKIGRFVRLGFELKFTAFTGDGNNFHIGGFPVNSSSSSSNRGEMSILIDNLSTAVDNPVLQVNVGTDDSVLIQGNGGTSVHGGVPGTYISASTVIRGTITYITA